MGSPQSSSAGGFNPGPGHEEDVHLHCSNDQNVEKVRVTMLLPGNCFFSEKLLSRALPVVLHDQRSRKENISEGGFQSSPILSIQ